MIAKNSPLIRVGFALLIVFLFTAGLHQLRSGSAGAPDFVCGDSISSSVPIEIAQGASGAQIGRTLYENKVIKSSEAFFRLAVTDARASSIAPGTHELSTRLCAKEALDQLLDSARIVGLIKIFEGEWNSEIVDQMVEKGFDRTELVEAIRSAELPAGITSSEGVLFPAQYSFAKDTSAASAISAMIARGTIEIEKAQLTTASGKYSLQDLVTIASIVQAEGDEKDFTKISRVIRNRVEGGMPLQMDSTVHYIKATRGQIFLSTKSTLLRSPYNTYQNYGLPPGPIGNPGRMALEAAVNPAMGDWLYFITVAPGDTRFTASSTEFLEWKIEYKKNLRNGLFSRSEK
jgi:UPF0755 protein